VCNARAASLFLLCFTAALYNNGAPAIKKNPRLTDKQYDIAPVWLGWLFTTCHNVWLSADKRGFGAMTTVRF
jgi:hypothetical protein